MSPLEQKKIIDIEMLFYGVDESSQNQIFIKQRSSNVRENSFYI